MQFGLRLVEGYKSAIILPFMPNICRDFAFDRRNPHGNVSTEIVAAEPLPFFACKIRLKIYAERHEPHVRIDPEFGFSDECEAFAVDSALTETDIRAERDIDILREIVFEVRRD